MPPFLCAIDCGVAVASLMIGRSARVRPNSERVEPVMLRVQYGICKYGHAEDAVVCVWEDRFVAL
jgi:hypothetical protein